MAILNNKIDFETALADMISNIDALDACVDDAIMATIKKVVDEYQGHLQSDIEELMSTCDELQELVDKE